jgi:hypothetical protein
MLFELVLDKNKTPVAERYKTHYESWKWQWFINYDLRGDGDG